MTNVPSSLFSSWKGSGQLSINERLRRWFLLALLGSVQPTEYAEFTADDRDHSDWLFSSGNQRTKREAEVRKCKQTLKVEGALTYSSSSFSDQLLLLRSSRPTDTDREVSDNSLKCLLMYLLTDSQLESSWCSFVAQTWVMLHLSNRPIEYPISIPESLNIQSCKMYRKAAI